MKLPAAVREQFTCDVRREIRLPYLLAGETEPRGGAAPCVLYLHGAGEKGRDLTALEASSAFRALARRAASERFALLAPQCPKEVSGWDREELAIFLRSCLEKYLIDADRVYLTGISMGGRGAWEFAYDHAEMLAGLAPVAAFGISNLAPRLARLPVSIYHGEEDAVVPVDRAREMFVALKKVNAEARLEALPGVGHSCGEKVYGDDAFWSWLLGQRRAGRSLELADGVRRQLMVTEEEPVVAGSIRCGQKGMARKGKS